MDKLRSVAYFVKVAEKKSIVAAAQSLGVSASGVSKVISALETSLGFPLFHRSTRRINLTDEGALYLDQCRRILQDIEESESDIRNQRRTARGTIRVAMHPGFRNPFFAGLGAFLTKHPEMRLETKIANSTSILAEEGFDLLIRMGPLVDSSLVARSIGWLELIVVASTSYLSEFGEPKTPADLARHRIVVPDRIDNVRGHSPHLEFMRGNRRYAVTVPIRVAALDNIGLPEMVIGGAGIACLSSIAFMLPIQAGLVKRILPSWRVDAKPVHAVFPNRRAVTPKSVALVDYVSGLVAQAEKAFPHGPPRPEGTSRRGPRTADR